MLSIIQKSLR